MIVLKLSWELQTDKYSPNSETGEEDNDKGKAPGTFNKDDVAEDVNENCIGDGSWDAKSLTTPASASLSPFGELWSWFKDLKVKACVVKW